MSVKRGLNCSNTRNSPQYLYWGGGETDWQTMRHSAGTHRTSSSSSNSDRQMVHFSVLSSKSSVLLFTCDTEQQWTSCWLYISNNTHQSTCCMFQSNFGLIVTQSTALGWQWYVEWHKRWASPLSKYVGTSHRKWGSTHSGTERGGHKRWQSWTPGLSCVSPNEQWFPILLMVLASWNNALQDKHPPEHKQPAQLYYNIICNTGTGTKETWFLYVPKYKMGLLFFTIHHLKQRGRGANHLTIKH
jgi:hypothetical protein